MVPFVRRDLPLGRKDATMAKTYVPAFFKKCYDLNRYIQRHESSLNANFIDTADVTNLASLKPLVSYFAAKWPPEREAP